MPDFDTLFLCGVIAAFVSFAVVLAAVPAPGATGLDPV